MPRQLRNLILIASILVSGLIAHADETTDSLDQLTQEIQTTVASLSASSLSNLKRLDLAKTQKAQFELELKKIIQKENREEDTAAAHDAAYDKVDELLLGLTAITELKLNPDLTSVTEESYENAKGLLRVFSQAGGLYTPSPAHEPFLHIIEQIHSNQHTI